MAKQKMKLLIDSNYDGVLTDSLINLLHQAADYAAAEFCLSPDAEISLLIVGDQEIAGLNLKYRGISSPTDVLSFPLLEKNDDITSADMLGDIVISFPRAQEQADNYGHSFEREVAFLFSHGLLHLLGYDHIDPREEKEMRLLQEKILDRLGLKRGTFKK